MTTTEPTAQAPISPASSPGLTRPPLVKGLPFVGNILPLMRDPMVFFRSQFQRMGPVYQVGVLNQKFTVLAGPSAVELMASNDGSLSNWEVWEGVAQDFGSEKNLGMMEGEEHSFNRKVMRQGFSKNTINDNIAYTVDITRKALDRLTVGESFAVMPFMRRLVSEQIGLLTIGRAPDDYLDDFIEYWQTIVQVKVAMGWPEKRLKSPAYIKARRRVEEMARQILAEHRASGLETREGTFADDLIKAADENPHMMSEPDLLFNLLTPYVAGLDTVANTCGFMMVEILRNPALQQRLQAEVMTAFADGLPTPDKLRKMPVMHAAAMETMRMYPITGILNRYASRDFSFQGYQINKGERLTMAIGVQNHIDQYFRQPDTFDIDRFMEPRNEHKQKNALAPYGAGSHTCLGAGMAEVELALTVATLLHDTKMALTEPIKRIKPVFDPSLSLGNNFRLKLVERRT